MFNCTVKVMPMMGKSVCEVTTDQGTHTAIAPTHQQAWSAAMTMARMVMEQKMGVAVTPEPVAHWEDPELISQILGSVKSDCQCPACTSGRDKPPHTSTH
jgi:hypothetical protein